MPPIRVLIVDDSVVVRKVVSDALAVDPGIAIAGTAADGRIALAKIPLLTPDLITLDVEMPGLNGIETLKEIRRLYPKLPVIMFSTMTERGAAITLDALSLGAADYATKPSKSGDPDVAAERVRSELIPKIKAICALRSSEPEPLLEPLRGVPTQNQIAPVAQRQDSSRIDILAIGASTGGPNALAQMLPAFPKNFPVPIVIVQHMPPLFTRLLSERLNDKSKIAIREGEPGQIVEPGVAWIAPGDFHMTVERFGGSVRIVMNQEQPENSCRPAVDVLFRSVAKVYGANSLAVVLTGMGSDGVRGSQHIREQGGRVFVQDEASSVVWGMPGMVAEAGQADDIIPLDIMAYEIVRRIKNSRSAPALAPSHVVSAMNPLP
ncbi:MAG: chemotaxis response regulator protein-glutamate methylesterase [Acidobacteriia bacterium]|nr:chemotaxis response regulator protein-glutamate methylesterase [Terriglobia bacterium]